MTRNLSGNERVRRRSLLQFGAGGLGATAVTAATLPLLGRGGRDVRAQDETPANPLETRPHEGHTPGMTVGDVDIARLGFDPSVLVRTFDYGEATTMADGTVVREWEIAAYDKEIEIAPGIFFPAWTYNGQVPGPTLRANAGD
ncbi:MAG: copper oxidase, partial [Chloroflexota bacterium]|nr:copper oxidase [Chloroflexota bacterium]